MWGSSIFMVGLCLKLSSTRAIFFFSLRRQVSSRSSGAAWFKLYSNDFSTSSGNPRRMAFSHLGPLSPCSRQILAIGFPPVWASPSVA